ncbi:hypothetical protein DITRI_Ditri04bG0021300 [Diplodiscus trichospermus]
MGILSKTIDGDDMKQLTITQAFSTEPFPSAASGSMKVATGCNSLKARAFEWVTGSLFTTMTPAPLQQTTKLRSPNVAIKPITSIARLSSLHYCNSTPWNECFVSKVVCSKGIWG